MYAGRLMSPFRKFLQRERENDAMACIQVNCIAKNTFSRESSCDIVC